MPNLTLPYCCCPDGIESPCLPGRKAPRILYLCSSNGPIALVYEGNQRWVATASVYLCGISPSYTYLACEERYGELGFYLHLVCIVPQGEYPELILGPAVILSEDPLVLQFDLPPICDGTYPCGYTPGAELFVRELAYDCVNPDCQLPECGVCYLLYGLEHLNRGFPVILSNIYGSGYLSSASNNLVVGYASQYPLHRPCYVRTPSLQCHNCDALHLDSEDCESLLAATTPSIYAHHLVVYDLPLPVLRVSANIPCSLDLTALNLNDPYIRYQLSLQVQIFCDVYYSNRDSISSHLFATVTYLAESLTLTDEGCLRIYYRYVGAFGDLQLLQRLRIYPDQGLLLVSVSRTEDYEQLCTYSDVEELSRCCKTQSFCARTTRFWLYWKRPWIWDYFNSNGFNFVTPGSLGGCFLPITSTSIELLDYETRPWELYLSGYNHEPCCFQLALYKGFLKKRNRPSLTGSGEIVDVFRLMVRLDLAANVTWPYLSELNTSLSCTDPYVLRGNEPPDELDSVTMHGILSLHMESLTYGNRIPVYHEGRTILVGPVVFLWCSAVAYGYYTLKQAYCPVGAQGSRISLDRECQGLSTTMLGGMDLPDHITLYIAPSSSSICDLETPIWAGEPVGSLLGRIQPYDAACDHLDDSALEFLDLYDAAMSRIYRLFRTSDTTSKRWTSAVLEPPVEIATQTGVQRIELVYGPIGDSLGRWHYRLIPQDPAQPIHVIENCFVSCEPFQVIGYDCGQELRAGEALWLEAQLGSVQEAVVQTANHLDATDWYFPGNRSDNPHIVSLRLSLPGMYDAFCSLSSGDWSGLEFELVRIAPGIFVSEVLDDELFCPYDRRRESKHWVALSDGFTVTLLLLGFNANRLPERTLVIYSGHFPGARWPTILVRLSQSNPYQEWPDHLQIDLGRYSGPYGACCVTDRFGNSRCLTTLPSLCSEIYQGQFLGPGTRCYAEGCQSCTAEDYAGECAGFSDTYQLEIIVQDGTDPCSDFFHRPLLSGQSVLFTREFGTCYWHALSDDAFGWLFYDRETGRFRVHWEKMGLPVERVEAESYRPITCQDLRIEMRLTNLSHSLLECPDGPPRIIRISLWKVFPDQIGF